MNPTGASKTSALSRLLASPAFLGWLLASLTLATFWPVVHCGFVNYDDPDYYYANPHVLADLSLGSLRWAFTTNFTGNWHPLTWLSLMADAQLFGADPLGAHLTNLLLHLVATVLLFLLLRRLTGAHWRSAVVAALFAVHPLHVESVAWISERKDVLSAVFGLATLWFYLDWQRAKTDAAHARHEPRFYALTVLCLVLGLMSKPMLVTLPCLMLLLDFWPLGRMTGNGETHFRFARLKELTLEKIPFFGLCALAAFVTLWVQRLGGNVTSLTRIPLSGRLENTPVAYVRYLGKTFWPVDLAVLYPHPGSWPLMMVGAALVLLLAITVVVVRQWRQQPYLLMGWLWFTVMLVPVIGLLQVGVQAIADRYTYLPHIGLFMAIVWLASSWVTHVQMGRIVLSVATAVVLAACVLTTRAQLAVWKNSETLLRHTLAVTKDNQVAWNNLAEWLVAENRYPETIPCYEALVRLNPAGPTVWLNWLHWGNALAALGDLPGAVEKFSHARQLAPDRAEAADNLGWVLGAQGKADEAIALYETALRLDPNYANAHNNLGAALYGQGKFAEAEAHYRAATRLVPGNAAWLVNLGDALVKLDRAGDAADCYRQALQLAPGNPAYQQRLQNLFAPGP